MCALTSVSQCVNPIALRGTGQGCLRLAPLAGFALQPNGTYASCGPPPPFAMWIAAPTPSQCLSQCLYSYAADATGACPACSATVCPLGYDRPMSSVYTGPTPARQA